MICPQVKFSGLSLSATPAGDVDILPDRDMAESDQDFQNMMDPVCLNGEFRDLPQGHPLRQ